MRVRSTSTYNRRVLPHKVITFATSVIFVCIGFLASFPFLYVVFFLGINFHYMSFWVILMLLGLMLGAPMFLGGMIGVLTSGRISFHGNASLNEIEMARIRHAVETDFRRKQ